MTMAPRPTRGFTLGKAFGGRIVVQPSTLLMLAVLAILFSTNGGGELTRRSFTLGLLLAVLLFVSVFVHELAHAATAKAFGREVHEVVITLWGGHTSFDARGITPKVSGFTALAGPVANVALAGIGLALLSTDALEITFLALAEGDITVALVVRWFVFANLILAGFNALPGIPMDGGRVLESVVWAVTGNRYGAMKVAAWSGRIIAVGVVVYALGAPFLQGRPPTFFDVAWAGLIFLVLWPAASSALKVADALGKRATVTVASLMVSAVAVPFDRSVADARAAAVAIGATEVVVVAADGAAAGHFPVALTDAVPEDARGATSLQSVTMPMPRGAELAPDASGEVLVEALREWWGKTDVCVVIDHGGIAGVVRLADVMKALQ